MDGIIRMKLKPDSVPTIFSFAKPSKRRVSSIQREKNVAKKICLEQALQECEASKKVPQQATNTNTVNKAVECNPKQLLPKTKSVRTQYKPTDILDNVLKPAASSNPVMIKMNIPKKAKGVNVGVNTELSFPCNDDIDIRPRQKQSEQNKNGENAFTYESTDEEFEEPDNIQKDPDFEPEVIEEQKELPKDTKLIVFWTCLLPLLQCCMICRQLTFIKGTFFKGTQLIVDLACQNGHETKWHSQPNIRGFAAGNIWLAASTLFSGCTFQRIKEVMSVAKIPFMSKVTFYSIQKRFLFPAIHRVFVTNRALLFDFVRRRGHLDLLGDGRCDSPGYSAKYGTYTVMDAMTNFILDFHVSHCKMAGNSARMELDGLKNVLRRFDDQAIPISSLTTDRHKQVRKYLKTMRKDIDHQFDVWHIGRNIKKKLLKLAKKKARRDLQPWIKSIINHFWWCCASCNGDAKVLKENWVSILYHIVDKHSWKEGKTTKKCKHPRLTKEQRSRKPFLSKDSPSYIALEKVVLDPNLLGAFDYLTKFSHTGTLEVYHSLYNKYCPKRLHFSYAGMIARSQLAVLDHNSGVDTIQSETKKGDPRYKLQFSKVMQSWVVKAIKEPKQKHYIEHLLFEVFESLSTDEVYEVPKLENVPDNIAPGEKPSKQECIKNKKT